MDELSATAREFWRKATNLSPAHQPRTPAPYSDVLANLSYPAISHYFARTRSRFQRTFDAVNPAGHSVSLPVSGLQPVASLLVPPARCCQCLAASFAKNRGVGIRLPIS